MVWLNKTLINGVVEEMQETTVVVPGVEQSNRFIVEAKLRPGPDFKDFLQCPQPAGLSDKGVTQFCHSGLALMHATGNV